MSAIGGMAASLLDDALREAAMMRVPLALIALLSLALVDVTFAQEHIPSPYFVTYDHYMEEKGALEISTYPLLGRDPSINTFWSNLTEFEYGTRRWWTSELYLDWQHTRHEG